MCDEGQTKLDVYDWVLSPEIREHMRTARPLTIEERRTSSTAAAVPSWTNTPL